MMREFGIRVSTRRMCLALMTAAALLVVAQTGQAADMSRYVPSEYIIRVIPGTDLATVQSTVTAMGCSLIKPLALDDTYLIKMNRSAKALSKYGASTSRRPLAWVIERIQPNYIKRPMALPNDVLWEKMWDMRQINMPAAWDIVKGSSSVVVSVNDTGVAQHPDLVNRLLPGYDFFSGDNDASPDPGSEGESHGTHCAGTVAAQGNNQIGVCGVCWDGVKILPVRIMSAAGGSTDLSIEGLDFSMRNGADVVSMSYGGYGVDPAEHDKIKQLAAAGIILVAAAGNDATDIPSYPAGFPEVVSVSATGPYEAMAPYSNYGKVEIAAPGGDANYGPDGCVWSTFVTWDGNGDPVYDYKGDGWQGTSMACPHVAGAAALLLSSGVARDEVVSRLLTSARAPKSGGMDRLYYGAGILDVQAALSNTVLKVIEPGKGKNVTGIPHFRIQLRNVSLTSIKIYLDYADLNDDGVPDNASEAQIVNGSNVNYFWDAATGTLEFDWLDSNLHLPQASGPLSAGSHSVYVSGMATTGGATVSDWATFYVVTRKMTKGIHMVSFPYALSDRMVVTPADILPGAKFGAADRPRSTLIRWIAAPRSSSNSAQIGYKTYVPGTLTDQTWVTPSYTTNSQSVLLGGGSFQDLFSGEKVVASPAGSGFWLIVPEDVSVDETFPTLESQINFDGSKGFEIPLYKGWNLIGNPYAHDVPWRAALFTYHGQTKSLLDAESAGWVRSTLYGYGGSSVGYVRITDRDSLEPFGGYWLLAQVGGIDASDALSLTILP